MSITVFQIDFKSGFKMAFEFQHKLRLLSLLQLDDLVSTLVILLYGFSDGSGLRLCVCPIYYHTKVTCISAVNVTIPLFKLRLECNATR